MGLYSITELEGGRFRYRSRQEATAATGGFYLESFKISGPLASKISDFISNSGITTFLRDNKAKTSRNIYTPRFTLRNYIESGTYGTRIKYGYMTEDNKRGWYSNDMDKFEEKREKCPSIEEIYYWCCRKYYEDVLWVNCIHKDIFNRGRKFSARE